MLAARPFDPGGRFATGLGAGEAPAAGMEIRYIDTERALREAQPLVAGLERVALDCEAAGFHRYSDRLSLVQLTAGPATLLFDPFASIDLEGFLRPVLEPPGVQVIMHGADYDVRLLDRDLKLRPRGLFDTQIAAELLGEEAVGLSSLLERHLGVSLSKKYQKADWAKRPLPGEMLQYAAMDTRHLDDLAALLNERLRDRGRWHWAEEEFRILEGVRFEAPDPAEDPVERVKAARSLEPREVARLRAALAWRERVARDRDRAVFRIAGDPVLVEVARRGPRSVARLAQVRGLNARVAREEGVDLLRRLDAVDSLPDAEIEGYPRRRRGNGRGRPDPEVEERLLAAKQARNERAVELGIARGTLLPNHVLRALAEDPPESLEGMAEMPGIRRWQVEVVGDRVLNAIREPARASG